MGLCVPSGDTGTEICTQHLFAPPPSLQEKVPGISPQVEQVITVAPAKDPKQRFASIQGFARALEQASQAAEPTVVVPGPYGPTLPAATQMELHPDAEKIPTPAPASPEPQTPSLPPPASTPPAETPGAPPPPQKEPEEARLLQRSSEVSASVAATRSAWSVGRRQMVALLVGVALFGLVSRG